MKLNVYETTKQKNEDQRIAYKHGKVPKSKAIYKLYIP